MQSDAHCERPSIGPEGVEGPVDEVGVGAADVGAGPDDVGAEAVGWAEQRWLESASAALTSADVHFDMRHDAATPLKSLVQRQAVSVSPLQPCLATAS